MCLPVNFLKKVVQFEGWVILLLSIVSLAFAIFVTVLEKGIVGAFSDLGYDEIEFMGVAASFWVSSGVIFGLALCGLIGVRKRSKCLLAIFNLGNVCVFLSFFCLTIIAMILEVPLSAPICFGTGQIDLFYKTAESQLCHSGCPCYFDGDIKNVNQDIIAVDAYEKKSSLPTRFQECPAFSPIDDEKAQALQLIESKLDCSGWCQGYPIQMFNDVNAPVKNYNNPCYQAMFNYARSIVGIFESVFLSFTIILGIFIVFTCCLCCHPEMKNKSQDFYTRISNQ